MIRAHLRYIYLRVKCLFGQHSRYSTWCLDCGERSWVCIACNRAALERDE